MVGGDFHDVFQRPDGLVMAPIGDVMGKGIVAAGYTETVRSAVRALALADPSPGHILHHVDLLLQTEESEQFVSAQLLMLDPASGRAFLASGGHPPAIHLSGTDARQLEKARGPLLGLGEGRFRADHITLEPGDAIIFYTDGLTEARRDGHFFGEKRALSVAGDCADLLAQAIVD